jgi:hypothetical protein
MSGFYKYLESKGIKEIRNISLFVHNFLQDPSIFYELTETEREEMEKKLDGALAHFKIEKG